MALLYNKNTVLASLRAAYVQSYHNDDLVATSDESPNRRSVTLPELVGRMSVDLDGSDPDATSLLSASPLTTRSCTSPASKSSEDEAGSTMMLRRPSAPQLTVNTTGLQSPVYLPQNHDISDSDGDDSVQEPLDISKPSESAELNKDEFQEERELDTSNNVNGNGDVNGADSDEDEDTDDDMSVFAAESFEHGMGYELNIDDEDSDFEEDMLRAAQQVKLDGPVPGALGTLRLRKSTGSSRTLRSRRSSLALNSRIKESNSSTRLSFPKQAPHDQPYTSSLTAGLSANSMQKDPRDQYKEAIAGIGEGGYRSPFPLTLYLPGGVPISFSVNPDASVHLTVGYALSLEQARRLPAFNGGAERSDANRWNLRLAEDDGEPDEDFPALNRSRPIVSYHVDEFALVEATPAEFLQNSQQTPNKISFTQSKSSTLVGSSTPKQDHILVRVFAYPYDAVLSDVMWEDTGASSVSKVYEVFENFCRERSLDQDMYVLRTADSSHNLVVLDQRLDALMDGAPSVDFELVPRRALLSAAGSSTDLESLVKQTKAPHTETPVPIPKKPKPFGQFGQQLGQLGKPRKSRKVKQHLSISELGKDNVVLPMEPLGFHKYRIWRRERMERIIRSKHPRELVIDGEAIHIMPSSDRSLLETPKTTTFNVSQVLRIKQSQKYPPNFKIHVRKVTNDKWYYLEGVSSAETAEIVDKILRLKQKR